MASFITTVLIHQSRWPPQVPEHERADVQSRFVKSRWAGSGGRHEPPTFKDTRVLDNQFSDAAGWSSERINAAAGNGMPFTLLPISVYRQNKEKKKRKKRKMEKEKRKKGKKKKGKRGKIKLFEKEK